MLQKRTIGQGIGGRTFGKLGKRAAARIDAGIDGGLATTGHSAQCRIDNVSRDGCCLHLSGAGAESPPRLGADVLVRIERVEALGRIAWSRSGRCGVKFAEPLAPAALKRLRWMVANTDKHERNVASSATAMWR